MSTSRSNSATAPPPVASPTPNFVLWECRKDLPCVDTSLCCSKQGFCSATADACDIDNGCQGNCKEIPKSAECSTFNGSGLFPALNETKTRPMYVKELPVPGTIDPDTQTVSSNCTTLLPPADHALKPCELVDAMGGPGECKYCLYYYDRIREAAEAFDIIALSQPACNSTKRMGAFRLASFLAQIRHMSKSLTEMYDVNDRSAGALHMTPDMFETATKAIPRLQSMVDSVLPGLIWANVPADIKLQRALGLIISAPQNSFLTAGWWFTDGLMSRADCGDLRLASDEGIGTSAGPTGFYKVSKCVSAVTDPSLRLPYYTHAVNVTKTFSLAAESLAAVPPPETTGSATSSGMGISGGVAFFASFLAVFLVAVGLVTVYQKVAGLGFQRNRRPRHSISIPQQDDDVLEQGGSTNHSPPAQPASRPSTTYIYEHSKIVRPMYAAFPSAAKYPMSPLDPTTSCAPLTSQPIFVARSSSLESGRALTLQPMFVSQPSSLENNRPSNPRVMFASPSGSSSLAPSSQPVLVNTSQGLAPNILFVNQYPHLTTSSQF